MDTLVAWRRGRVDTLARLLRNDLVSLASCDEGLVSIALADGGWKRTLVFNSCENICTLSNRKDTHLVDLFLAGNYPVGPWGRDLVVELFSLAKAKEVVVPTNLVMPKISHTAITPEYFKPTNENGYELCVRFLEGTLAGACAEQQRSIISQAMNTGLETWDCCHFFEDMVCMFFLDYEGAQKARERVKSVCL